MPPEIVALIDKPALLALVLGFGAFIGIAVERFMFSIQGGLKLPQGLSQALL